MSPQRTIPTYSVPPSLNHSTILFQKMRNMEVLSCWSPQDANTLEDTFGSFDHMEQVPQPSESKEPEMTTKNHKYNLRKSSAWDSAFFTSAGVLKTRKYSRG
ncbi:uncharacterized protein LOC142641504 [Castanea sativa]|uniref:uncharacterized protein LOC142641504 n=1 Tax=Castanea sativa TaxID=21020 RepID=UPI003F652ED1